jgi:intracellular multiplication protein IcmJ
MSYLRIAPGIGGLSDTGRTLPGGINRPPEELRQKVLERDNHSCRYCGFTSRKYQEVNLISRATSKGETAKPDYKVEDYATACIFCHQCFHLERLERMQSGAVIWLPEIGQATLHHLCRAIYVARISQGPMADAARDAMESLLARKEEARNRLGTDSPKILATVLQDFFEAGEYKNRLAKLKGFRILPLDRRIIKEGDLEFNQFPQVLAYWRSKDGPFGEMPPRKWAEILYTARRLPEAAKTDNNKAENSKADAAQAASPRTAPPVTDTTAETDNAA